MRTKYVERYLISINHQASQLQPLMYRSDYFVHLDLENLHVFCCPAIIDYTLTTRFLHADHSVWLDITGIQVSTLSFLISLPNLELLCLANCKQLIDQDFVIVKVCLKLEYLNVNYTSITSATVIHVFNTQTMFQF